MVAAGDDEMSIEDSVIRENRLKAVLHKIHVFNEIFSNHLPTADEIHDRNTLDMCQVLVDRIAELEALNRNLQESLDGATLDIEGLKAQDDAAKQVISDWQNDYAPDPLPDGVLQFVEDLSEAMK